MSEMLLVSNVDGSPTSPVGAADVTIGTYHIKPNTYDYVRFDTTLQIATTAGSLGNNILIKVKLNPLNIVGGPFTLTTFNYKTDAAARVINQHLCYVGSSQMQNGLNSSPTFAAGGTLTITINAATDANTVFTALNCYLEGKDQ